MRWSSRAVIVVALLGAAAAAGADLEAAQARLEQALMAPCCFHDTVAAHRSPASDAVRADVRQRLLHGESEQAILADYVERYGERILAAPRLAGFGLLAWLTPSVALLAAGGLVWRWLRRHQRADAGHVSVPAAGGLDDARLAAELARFDG